LTAKNEMWSDCGWLFGISSHTIVKFTFNMFLLNKNYLSRVKNCHTHLLMNLRETNILKLYIIERDTMIQNSQNTHLIVRDQTKITKTFKHDKIKEIL